MSKQKVSSVFDFIHGDEDARVCKDIPDAACKHQPRNAFAYMFANLFNKIADEISSAKLILPWLLGALGAPAAFTGFLVPIREAGVLLPQLLVAAFIRKMAIRKYVWLLGGVLSALALALMALSVTQLTGASAGWAIILLLTLFSLARGLCSVSAKDVLGKTVSKGQRGNLMGYSAGFAGLATLGIGLYVQMFAKEDASISLMTTLLSISALLWVFAIISFAAIKEHPGSTEGGGNAITTALQSLSLLKTDSQFRHFVISRAMLLAVAFAPPFYVLLAQQNASNGLSSLGMMIIASGIGASVSSPIWGKLGDRSSRLVMVLASAIAGVLGIAVFILIQSDHTLMRQPLTYAVLYLALIIVHSGVRLGRKVYLVDMATAETRATYVAVSNTAIGVLMLFGGLIGIIADVLAVQYVVLILGLLSAAAAVYCWRLPEVSG
jgi:hypothetical protein